MSELMNCPKCNGENTYFDGTLNQCPDCGYEWSADTVSEDVADNTPRDSNGAVLESGDSVTVIKDLPVKGSSMVVKRGTKVKGIRLVEDDPTHIEGKVEGSGIYLKTCFLKKISE